MTFSPNYVVQSFGAGQLIKESMDFILSYRVNREK